MRHITRCRVLKTMLMICSLLAFSLTGHATEKIPQVPLWEWKFWGMAEEDKLKERAARSFEMYCAFLSVYLEEEAQSNYGEYIGILGDGGVRFKDIEQTGKVADLLTKHCSKYLP